MEYSFSASAFKDTRINRPTSPDNQRTEMLASSIMMMSISENEQVSNLSFRSALGSSTSSMTSSTGSLNGWGNTMTRTSYKVDLSTLCGQDESMRCQAMETSPPQSVDEWGFFVDTLPSRRH